MHERINQLSPESAEPHQYEQLETSIGDSLSKLPLELKRQWEERYENIEDKKKLRAFHEKLKRFIDKRSEALSTLNIHPDCSRETIEEILRVDKVIAQTFGRAEYFLGNGQTAEVYWYPEAQGTCVKYIYDQDAYNQVNHMRVEYNFLCELHGFEVEGIRTPEPLFLRIHPNEGHTYGMERIHGASLSQILERPQDFPELVHIARSLDQDEMLRKLQAYVRAMHEEKRISHNDLKMRNIMLDENGSLFVIDFGKARKEEVGDDHDMNFQSDQATIKSAIKEFLQKLDVVDVK